MRPVSSRDEYLNIRANNDNLDALAAARLGNKLAKSRLIQMNYSCYPNDEGKLKGSKLQSQTVGMDVDLDPSDPEYEAILRGLSAWIIGNAEKIGLLMLERSVNKGYHLVFKRMPEKSQEENLRHVSNLLKLPFDAGAKDITRVFFTTSPEDLLYLDDELFADNEPETKVIAIAAAESALQNTSAEGTAEEAEEAEI